MCAGETVAAAGVLDHLTGLVDKSLVVAEPRGPAAATVSPAHTVSGSPVPL